MDVPALAFVCTHSLQGGMDGSAPSQGMLRAQVTNPALGDLTALPGALQVPKELGGKEVKIKCHFYRQNSNST